MQIETRKVFEKDAGKLSSSEKKRLYTIIEVLSKADNLSKVSSCKNFPDIQMLIESGWALSGLDYFAGITKLN